MGGRAHVKHDAVQHGAGVVEGVRDVDAREGQAAALPQLSAHALQSMGML